MPKYVLSNDWPDCVVQGCPNKTCLVLDSPYCFPHTPGNKWVKHMKIDAKRGWLRRMTPQAVGDVVSEE